MATTKTTIKKTGGGGALSIGITLSKTFGNDAFKTTALAPRVRFAEAIITESKNWASKNAPRDTGKLAASFDKDNNGLNSIVVSGRDQRSVKITLGTSVGYGVSLDSGKRRKAGGPPPQKAILKWMRKVGLGNDPRIASSIAFTIARRGVKTGPKFLSTKNRNRPTEKWIEPLIDVIKKKVRDLGPVLAKETKQDILGRG